MQIGSRTGLDYDTNSNVVITGRRSRYVGVSQPATNILNRIISLHNQGRAFETELQGYFTENAGLGINPSLDNITGTGNQVLWLGNEVKCGVGMRSIDVFTILNHPRNVKEFRIIELKDEYIQPSITDQLFKYVNWTGQYITEAINANIQPIIVGQEIPEQADGRRKYKKTDSIGNPSQYWTELTDALHSFNARNLAKPILYYEYSINTNSIDFNQVTY